MTTRLPSEELEPVKVKKPVPLFIPIDPFDGNTRFVFISDVVVIPTPNRDATNTFRVLLTLINVDPVELFELI